MTTRPITINIPAEPQDDTVVLLRRAVTKAQLPRDMQFFTAQEAAALLSVSDQIIYDRISTGELAAIRFGGRRIIIKGADLLDFINVQ
jgi:excisionase family DNA binding protein